MKVLNVLVLMIQKWFPAPVKEEVIKEPKEEVQVVLTTLFFYKSTKFITKHNDLFVKTFKTHNYSVSILRVDT